MTLDPISIATHVVTLARQSRFAEIEALFAVIADIARWLTNEGGRNAWPGT
ncbi:MAG TPA: hypothetical protein VHW44_17570 [Pseudonocardiaceae bacterium]|nr:hypothetical protein [Pseudonocardiaceae bacterium]